MNGGKKVSRSQSLVCAAQMNSEDIPEAENTEKKAGNGDLVTGMTELQLSKEKAAAEDRKRREAWERGQMDYMGSDSFENILRKINQTLARKIPIGNGDKE
ncbi:Glycogenin-1 [Amphibalanus amphitrite]|uniref:Glycogenin-1 n=1 Tax=Amphibalanus amphitrite TaxID=1232801 RepID=A0A6A4VJZ2_AMPAM|nr:Glycogenin-1 [Amphibalanus amphitrite]